jgi:hypothetical protein
VSDTPSNDGLAPGGPVECWLDRIFDGLTGTGAGGRRALAEIEDHLREAVADGIGRGLRQADAEHEAVARFGSADRVARGVRAAHRSLVRPALTGTWLLGGAATLTLGIATVLTGLLDFVVDGHLDPRTCQIVDAPGAAVRACGPGGGLVLTMEGLELVGVALVALGMLGVVRRRTAMRAVTWLPRTRSLVLGATLFALTSLYLLGTPYSTFARQYRSHSPLIPPACALVATAVGLLVPFWLARLKQRRASGYASTLSPA